MVTSQNQHHWTLQLVRRMRIQSWFPALSPVGGWKVFRSDQQNLDFPSEYFYDSTRSKWFAHEAWEYVFTGDAGVSGYLEFQNANVSSATWGYILHKNMTLIGMKLLRTASGTALTYRVTANGTDKAQMHFNSGDLKSTNDTLNIDFSEDDVVGCRLLSGTNVGNVTVQTFFRRRYT